MALLVTGLYIPWKRLFGPGGRWREQSA